MSELRKRNVGHEDDSDDNLPNKSNTITPAIAERYIRAVAENSSVPASVRPYLEKAAPLVGQLVELINISIPYFHKGYVKVLEIKKSLEPYRLELLTPAFFGIIMCFFGGSYLTVIAAFEAYRSVGWKPTYDAILMLQKDIQTVIDTDCRDNAVDKDGNGISDVLEIPPQELLQRKFYLFFKVLQPDRVYDAITAISTGFIAVIATLKVDFVKAITLGASMADVINKPAQHYLTPIIDRIMPEDFKHWTSFFITYTVKSVTISLAWMIQRIVSAFHSALRGGHMIGSNLLEYLSVMGIIHLDPEHTYIDEIIGYAFSFFGLYFQLSYGFKVPFLLQLVLFPFSMVEYFLMAMIAR